MFHRSKTQKIDSWEQFFNTTNLKPRWRSGIQTIFERSTVRKTGSLIISQISFTTCYLNCLKITVQILSPRWFLIPNQFHQIVRQFTVKSRVESCHNWWERFVHWHVGAKKWCSWKKTRDSGWMSITTWRRNRGSSLNWAHRKSRLEQNEWFDQGMVDTFQYQLNKNHDARMKFVQMCRSYTPESNRSAAESDRICEARRMLTTPSNSHTKFYGREWIAYKSNLWLAISRSGKNPSTMDSQFLLLWSWNCWYY